jgi:periplasmic protein TonB
LTIKKFIFFSIVVHIGIVVGLYFIPEGGKNKTAPFFARLVSPEELRATVEKPPLPPPQMKKNRDPRVPKDSPAFPIRPKYVPSPDEPVVPGQGKETGKHLPEGIYPKPVYRDKGVDPVTENSSAPGGAENSVKQAKPTYSAKKRLYDPEIIGDIAMKETQRMPKKDDSITFDTSDYRYAGYMKKLKEKIESIWIYPPEARMRGLYGDLKIQFTIRKNGKLGAVDLVRTSGYKVLDDAAIRALKDGEPYWPVPEEWGMESYTILGHFVYTIYGYSVK